MEWINVEDKLPKNGQMILGYGVVLGEIYGYREEKRIAAGKWPCMDLPADYYSASLDKITHWMPLPEAPSE